LQTEFPGMGGFSAANLWRVKQLDETYVNHGKTRANGARNWLVHNVIIMEKCKDDLEREFYICMTRKFDWTKNVLVHQIENQSYRQFEKLGATLAV
jgi:DUF1016 N-terminal domain